MSDLIKYAAIGIGGYFLYEWLVTNGILGTAVATPVITTSAAVNPSAVVNPSTAIAGNTLSKLTAILLASNANLPGSYQNVDTWNFYYRSVRGVAGPAPETLFPGVDRNKMYSLAEYWSAMTGAGFSGLGVIANHVNPYWDRPSNMRAGQNMNPNGMERYIIQKGG